ncbi:ABC transporter ATP-binding protein [uncultured Roseibium sp.]|uniref:ABC transporter ATP-binding protein n=1 Tax=uncultured Roseibium sp. TaxID=1936171 RepID=UPI00260B27B7|nr:ABC transporter ATP-binding protein [uncultured Roseibium sp.]
MTATGIDTGATPVLSVQNLSVVFGSGAGRLHALDNISLTVGKGEIRAIVGESGCGKSVTMMAILGLLPQGSATIDADAIRLGETDLRTVGKRVLRSIRGRRIGMIFQDPMTSLTPVHTVGFQIGEVLREHLALSRREARLRALELLDLVRIPDPKRRLNAYPHELSGGMRQRVMIAMALACQPDLLIADEPTTALDVTVQAQILDLIAELREQMGMSVVLITHDLGVVAAAADRVSVMYAGRIVEEASVFELFRNPVHGYTAGLLRSMPFENQHPHQRLSEIPGVVPRLTDRCSGCAFFDRCEFSTPDCTEEAAVPIAVADHHTTLCRNHEAVSGVMRDHPIVEAWS